jgi:hypothetical protein
LGRTIGAGSRALRTRFVWWSALPMLLACPTAALAQPAAPAPTPVPAGDENQIVAFSADHQTNLVRNALLPAPMVLPKRPPIAPHGCADNRREQPARRSFAKL